MLGSLIDLPRTIALGAEFRRLGREATSMETAAQAICAATLARITRPDGARACVLVRVFVTRSGGELPDELRATWSRVAPEPPHDERPLCLVLLGTAGEDPSWNDRRASVHHQVLPLGCPNAMERAPMVAGLVEQLGIGPDGAARRAPMVPGFPVFLVPDARGSPLVPAQDFVLAHDVRSVVGFGGRLPSGGACAMVIFSNATVATEAVDVFRPLAPNLRLALGEHEDRVFA